MTLARLVALLAALLALATLVWLILAEHPLDPPGEPGINAEPVRNLEALIPSILPFETYAINNENPFIPFLDRKKQTDLINKMGNKPVKTAPKPGPVVVPEPAEPTLPRLATGASAIRSPVAVGIINTKDELVVIALLPGAKDPVKMRLKDESNGWRLESVEDGLIANITEISTGVNFRLLVDSSAGENDVQPQTKAETKPSADGKANGKGAKPTDGKSAYPNKGDKSAKTDKSTTKPDGKPEKPGTKAAPGEKAPGEKTPANPKPPAPTKVKPPNQVH